ncbi:MAG: Swt1 family HEPN domain-containing protein [Candidatus Methanofastidiosia archaeon]|jgi:hypothetical protein
MTSENESIQINPFQYGRPIRDPKDFFGREDEVRLIYHQIQSLNSTSIIGERKVGKTCLLLLLSHPNTLKKYKISDDFLMFYIDVSSCSFFKSSDVFRRFLECISEKVTGKVREEINILLEKKYIHFREFEKIIAKISNNNKKIVFLLDEFESISMVKQGDIFSRLRYLAQQYNLVYVISTLRDLMSLFQEERFSTSPFFNIFTNHQLRGLDKDACRELIEVSFERGGLEIDSSVIDSIIKFSGTNPYFLKLACFFYFEKGINGSTDFDDNLKDLIQQKLKPSHKYNWDHLSRSEQAALQDIIKSGNTMDTPGKISLESKGYIVEVDNTLAITSESFQDYLRTIFDSHQYSSDGFRTQIAQIDTLHNLTEGDKNALRDAISRIYERGSYIEGLRNPTFDLIRYFEVEMRKFIQKILKDILGKGWFNRAFDDTSKKEIEKRIEKEEKRSVNFRYPESLLDFAILENLRDVILRQDNWNLCFSKYFEDKKAFEVKITEIIDARNRIAHFRQIHFNEVVVIIQNILWTLDYMRRQVCSI